MALRFRAPTVSFPLKPSGLPSFPYPYSYPKRVEMSRNLHTNSHFAASSESTNRKLPILLFDIMGTIVRDPFYEDVPAFFGMSLKELVECKHPTAWIQFEKGIIDEVHL
ncbi:hypothetical protein CJ030_MR6G007363 [Morella rubra]|uniref:Uncharacterized protein n=1 Tax=Morella rubra TaxID=262757 RepID=A0A6A1VCI3_9ROSI|nr:hypothetical protein CJ030_MR6G007363 [Morella rubra]